ncbi:hypothetical protein PC9H_005786 [Pleurotus ostreatus]|uniref:Uncharacterized protein n=2 Tax=Pleurotus ostreatus TaxID=5322 RepID=A0A8H6ZXS0_PLEOS|nr:uncharacterized protein PC9H_008980 [Pleurotus ostreatus]XP_036633847.1 uncharacterized protein PC9H_005786 [Pleurotus ostreatus]KDQ26206.1 hypothetical protein PLEOSDRAFT_1107070 [Pleurotus ostreatus PC15]KAF7426611.1 hypothetical protein PC9H_008980 [Pleurotus ostreatus]KAF7433820.1 hypothetical protein PC9H_005786 [Pleurotus ostreatus]KAJ8697380.1 hypothetical protein PTI98_004190 [Pleurotus ostreatus]
MKPQDMQLAFLTTPSTVVWYRIAPLLYFLYVVPSFVMGHRIIVNCVFLLSTGFTFLALLSGVTRSLCSYAGLKPTSFCEAMLSSREFIAQLSGLSSELGQCAAQFQAYSTLAPPLLTNLSNIYVETRNVAFLVHSSNISSRHVIGPFLTENERDILDLSRSLLQLRHLVEGGSNQIRDLEGYVIRSSTMVVKWLGPDTAFCKIASLVIALPSCSRNPSASVVLSDVVSAFNRFSRTVASHSDATLAILSRFDSRLLHLGNLVNKEAGTRRQTYEVTLSSIWSTFGGNRAQLASISLDLDILQRAHSYVLAVTRFNFETFQAVEHVRLHAQDGEGPISSAEEVHNTIEALRGSRVMRLEL